VARPRASSADDKMATRWSRLHGELYLGRERGGAQSGAVAQRNRTMALGFVWFHGGGCCSPSVTARLREGDGEEEMARERERE
jgi:hypothetical protein